MATNQVFDDADSIAVACTDPATPNSGDPVLLGQLGGVALLTEDAAGLTTVKFRGAFKLSVKGVNAGGNTAIAAGDTIFYVTADTPKLSAKVAGVKFGTALDPVLSGATTTIRVRLNGAV